MAAGTTEILVRWFEETRARIVAAATRGSRRRTLMVAGSLAAWVLLAVIFFSSRRQRDRGNESGEVRGAVEFGFVTGANRTRDAGTSPVAGLGDRWQLAPHSSRVELERWSTASLPAEVSARIWIDEDAGSVRAVYRRRDGSMGAAEQRINTLLPIRQQLVDLRERITRE